MKRAVNGRKFWIAHDRAGVSACEAKRKMEGGVFRSSSVGLKAFGLEYMHEYGFLPKVRPGEQVMVQIVVKKDRRNRCRKT